jgi:hypothetical protein
MLRYANRSSSFFDKIRTTERVDPDAICSDKGKTIYLSFSDWKLLLHLFKDMNAACALKLAGPQLQDQPLALRELPQTIGYSQVSPVKVRKDEITTRCSFLILGDHCRICTR